MSGNSNLKPGRDIATLIAIMAALRTPGSGCPWDLAQSFETIAPYTIEEAYEVAEAIAHLGSGGDFGELRDELGDLLLQVVFHARMAEEAGAFAFGDVVTAITEKLIRRHPHVFGDGEAKTEANTEAEVAVSWQAIKAQEKAARAAAGGAQARASTLADVKAGQPALARALGLQKAAARVGFDWAALGPVIAKIHEEADEIAAAAAGDHPEAVAGEVGDLLFAVVNLARHLGVDPESALRTTNAKFERRFASIEQHLAAAGRSPEQSTLAEMDALWEAAKRAEAKQA